MSTGVGVGTLQEGLAQVALPLVRVQWQFALKLPTKATDSAVEQVDVSPGAPALCTFGQQSLERLQQYS